MNRRAGLFAPVNTAERRPCAAPALGSFAPLDDIAIAVADHIPRLRRYARALVGDRDMADDLVQDCVERALSRLHLWRREGDLRAWLFTIMHNVHVNAARRRNRTPTMVTIDPAMPHLTDPGLAVAPAQGAGLELAQLDRALGLLPVEQRQVILLTGLEGLRYEETAKVLGIPVGTVMSRLSRGREALRRMTSGDSGGQPRLTRVK